MDGGEMWNHLLPGASIVSIWLLLVVSLLFYSMGGRASPEKKVRRKTRCSMQHCYKVCIQLLLHEPCRSVPNRGRANIGCHHDLLPRGQHML